MKPRTERYKNYDIVPIPSSGKYRFRIMKVGGGVDVKPEVEADTEEDAIEKARNYIDTKPEMDSI